MRVKTGTIKGYSVSGLKPAISPSTLHTKNMLKELRPPKSKTGSMSSFREMPSNARHQSRASSKPSNAQSSAADPTRAQPGVGHAMFSVAGHMKSLSAIE